MITDPDRLQPFLRWPGFESDHATYTRYAAGLEDRGCEVCQRVPLGGTTDAAGDGHVECGVGAVVGAGRQVVTVGFDENEPLQLLPGEGASGG